MPGAVARALPASLSLALLACSPPGLLPELATAENARSQGNPDAALAAYEQAQTTCKKIADPRRRAASCASAHLDRADLLAELNRSDDAMTAYLAVPQALPDNEVAAGRALYRAGELELARNHERGAYELLWRVVTDYSNAPSADLALRLVVADGRQRNARQLYEELLRVATARADTELSDNLRFFLAELAEEDLRDLGAALTHYDYIAKNHKDGPLLDDALWHGARVARVAGDPQAAVTRYRQLLANREVALIVGSYFSPWHPEAQLELGRVLRDDLDQPRRALTAFRDLPELFPDSILHDDAMWETAVTWDRLGDRGRACAALTKLAKRWPDSRYGVEQAPEMRRRLACRI